MIETILDLKVVIADNEFHYEHRVGDSIHISKTPLTYDNLIAFAELLKFCRSVSNKALDKKND